MDNNENKDTKSYILDFRIPRQLVTDEVLAFAGTCAGMCKLYAKKNHDYGDSFNKGMKTIGTAYGVGRLYDKMNRIITLTKTEAEVKEESINDTLLDLACYAIMTYNSLNKDKDGVN